MEQVILHVTVCFSQIKQDQRYRSPLSNEVLVTCEGPRVTRHVHFTELACPRHVYDADVYPSSP